MTGLKQKALLDAQHAEQSKQYALAQQFYTQLLAQQPEDEAALLGAARVHVRLHEWGQAEAIYQRILQHKPSAVVWSHLAAMFLKQKKTEQATAAFEQSAIYSALGHHQKRLTALGYLNWMRVLLQLERPLDALRIFRLSDQKQADLVAHRWFLGIATRLVDQLEESSESLPVVDFLCQVQRLHPLLAEAAVSVDAKTLHLLSVLLRTASRYALFRPEVIALSTQIVQQRQGDDVLLSVALDLLLCWDLPSTEIAEAYQTLIEQVKKPSVRMLSGYAHVLFFLQSYTDLAVLGQRYPDLLTLADQQPAAAWLLQHQAQLASANVTDDALQPALQVLQAYTQVQQQTARFWADLANPAQSVAVVGNSACELGLAKGTHIDAHEVVIRFNAFSLDAPFDVDYGSKVDVQVRSAGSEPNLQLDAAYPNKIIVLSYMGFLHRFRRWQLVLELQAQGHQVCCYPAAVHHALIRRIGRSPSAGLSVTWILSQLRPATAPADYYGFAFVDQIGEQAISSHYFEQSVPSLRHDWRAEAQLFAAQTHVPITLPKPPRLVRLVGDHSAYHCGCSAVVDYLRRQIKAVGVEVEHADYDVLVVNGEGSMHHQAINHQKKIREMTHAVISGRPVFLVNTVWQDNGAQDQALMQQVTQICMREPLSQQDLWQTCQIAAQVHLDCSYWAAVDVNAATEDFKKTTLVTDFYSAEFEQFVKINGGVFNKYHYIDLRDWQWSVLVNSLKTASLLVTGRHHAMYAACRARTSFVVLRGNTHKIEGLIALSGLPIPVCQHPRELKAAIAWARKNRAVYEQLFDWMEAQPRLELAQMLQACLP